MLFTNEYQPALNPYFSDPTKDPAYLAKEAQAKKGHTGAEVGFGAAAVGAGLLNLVPFVGPALSEGAEAGISAGKKAYENHYTTQQNNLYNGFNSAEGNGAGGNHFGNQVSVFNTSNLSPGFMQVIKNMLKSNADKAFTKTATQEGLDKTLNSNNPFANGSFNGLGGQTPGTQDAGNTGGALQTTPSSDGFDLDSVLSGFSGGDNAPPITPQGYFKGGLAPLGKDDIALVDTKDGSDTGIRLQAGEMLVVSRKTLSKLNSALKDGDHKEVYDLMKAQVKVAPTVKDGMKGHIKGGKQTVIPNGAFYTDPSGNYYEYHDGAWTLESEGKGNHPATEIHGKAPDSIQKFLTEAYTKDPSGGKENKSASGVAPKSKIPDGTTFTPSDYTSGKNPIQVKYEGGNWFFRPIGTQNWYPEKNEDNAKGYEKKWNNKDLYTEQGTTESTLGIKVPKFDLEEKTASPNSPDMSKWTNEDKQAFKEAQKMAPYDIGVTKEFMQRVKDNPERFSQTDQDVANKYLAKPAATSTTKEDASKGGNPNADPELLKGVGSALFAPLKLLGNAAHGALGGSVGYDPKTLSDADLDKEIEKYSEGTMPGVSDALDREKERRGLNVSAITPQLPTTTYHAPLNTTGAGTSINPYAGNTPINFGALGAGTKLSKPPATDLDITPKFKAPEHMGPVADAEDRTAGATAESNTGLTAGDYAKYYAPEALGTGFDIARGVLGFNAANKPLPTFTKPEAWNQYVNRLHGLSETGLTGNEMTAAQRGIDQTYAYDVDNIRNLSGGNSGQALGNLGRAASSHYGALTNLAALNDEARARNLGQYGQVLGEDVNLNRMIFGDKYNETMQTKLAGGQLANDAIKNIGERVQTDKEYGPSSYYDQINQLNLQGAKDTNANTKQMQQYYATHGFSAPPVGGGTSNNTGYAKYLALQQQYPQLFQ